jgi:hypothetical protein
MRGTVTTKEGVKTQKYYCHGHQGYFLDRDEPENYFPAVLLLDIETLPMVGYFWDVHEIEIRPEQIIKDWCILSWSAKWLTDNKIMSNILTPEEVSSRDDKRLMEGFWKLLDEAQIVIGQNCKKFDLKKLNSRFFFNGMYPPSSYKVIDTLLAARTIFGETFNNLDTLAKKMGFSGKIKTDFSLWTECDNSNPKSLDKMRKYNEHDVELLEAVYLKMRPWIPNHPNFTIYEKVIGRCPMCFGNYENIGAYTAAKKQYDEFRCTQCHAVFHSTKPIK